MSCYFARVEMAAIITRHRYDALREVHSRAAPRIRWTSYLTVHEVGAYLRETAGTLRTVIEAVYAHVLRSAIAAQLDTERRTCRHDAPAKRGLTYNGAHTM